MFSSTMVTVTGPKFFMIPCGDSVALTIDSSYSMVQEATDTNVSNYQLHLIKKRSVTPNRK
jgi:hypothetical protein